MKDTEARQLIHEQTKLINDLYRIKWDGLKGVSLKDCPKCRHPVLAHFTLHMHSSGYHRCLTCGTKFTCSTKEVCEIVDAVRR